MKRLSHLPMKSRFLMSAGCLIVLVLASALSDLTSQKQTALGEAASTSFFTEEEVEATQLIRIETAENSYSLRKEPSGWVMSREESARVDPDKIARLLISLSALRTSAKTTALPERLDELGLGDPASGGFGARLSIDTGDEVLIFGVKRGRQYVRRADSAQSWRADPLLPPLHNPSWWLDLPDLQSLLGIDFVAAISEGNPARPLLPDDQEFFKDVLKDVRVSDVRAKSERTPLRTFRLGYSDGHEVVLELSQDDTGDWLAISERGGNASQEYLIDALSASDLASIEAPETSTSD